MGHPYDLIWSVLLVGARRQRLADQDGVEVCFSNNPQPDLQEGLGQVEIKPETVRFTVCATPCKLGCEGIVSKRLGSLYRSGRSKHWVKLKNPAAPAVRREAEEDWGR